MDKDEIKAVLKEYYKTVIMVLVPAFIGGAGILSFRYLRWFGLFLVAPLAVIVVYVFAEPVLDQFLALLLDKEEGGSDS